MNASTKTPTMTLKILPVGDSITDGGQLPGGYRTTLWNSFKASNLSVDFVGSLSNGPNSLGDKDHEGHSGWRIDEIANSINGWLNTQQPDIITLMIGTNDILDDFDVSAAPARLSLLIDQITNLYPNTHLLVASIPPISDATINQRVSAFNSTIPNIVSTKSDQGKKVTFVDISSKLNLSDLIDGIHPNEVGYNKIAQAWESAILSTTSQTPIVSITATDADASELGANPGTFTISRFGKTSEALTVNYAIGGTATNGNDYSQLSSSVTIPAGSTSASITVKPLDDILKEGNESVSLTLSNNAAYTIASSNSDTVTITNAEDAPKTTIDYLSNLTWLSTMERWGPIEKDKSNGEQNAGDGQEMMLNGTRYSNGLGMHGGSEVVYSLGGNYTIFSSDIGVDDEVGDKGTVTFEVWSDGAKLYDSGLMSGNTPTKTINLDVTGKQVIKLIATNGGDNFYDDHADWANARFIKAIPGSTAANDVITGNVATNVFVGSDGKDNLTGGGGTDIFSYTTTTEGNDIITDFSLDDRFYISASIFGGGLKANTSLSETAAATGTFVSGAKPTPLGASANFLYSTATGVLSFDRDGTGLGESLAIATLTGIPSLGATQFTIVH